MLVFFSSIDKYRIVLEPLQEAGTHLTGKTERSRNYHSRDEHGANNDECGDNDVLSAKDPAQILTLMLTEGNERSTCAPFHPSRYPIVG